jgi:S1-C subfamily serine protease
MNYRTIATAAAITSTMVLLGGCVADDYAEFYKPNTSVTEQELAARRLAPPPSEPELVRGSDPNADVPAALADGYLIVGSSTFDGAHATDTNAVAQAKAVGADRVLTFVKSDKAILSAAPITTSATQTPAVADGANAYGSSATATAFATGPETNGVSGPVGGYDYLAVYLVRARFAFGASYRNFSDREARSFREGVMVIAVVNGTPAAAAGLRSGDAIVEAGGHPVIDTQHFNDWLRRELGRPIALTIVRGGRKLDTTVRLATI